MDDNELSDISSLLGMSNIFNKDETDESINTKEAERDFIKKSLDISGSHTTNDDDLLSYNPINEYNSIIESINQDTNKSNEDSSMSFDDIMGMTDDLPPSDKRDTFESKLTEEQTNQKIVDSVLQFQDDKEDDNFNFNIDDENREDMKLTLLEKIDNLIEELEDDGHNLDKIPKVDYTSNLEKIEYVAKLLMLKANRNRDANRGEEFILAVANGMEILCNGKRKILGLQPNLTGYSDTVKVKLRKIRDPISQVVSNVVEKYEISPLMSILIELIPSAFLHSRRRNAQAYDSLYTDLSDDITEIRKYG